MSETKTDAKTKAREKCSLCHKLCGKITKVYSGEITEYSRDLLCDECRVSTSKRLATRPVCLVNETMTSDTKRKFDPVFVNHAAEGFSEDSSTNLVPSLNGVTVERGFPIRSYSPYLSQSTLYQGCSIVPEAVIRKKCAKCTGILHENEAVEPVGNVHAHCFKCSRCHKQLSPLNFKILNGMPYCEPICQNVRVQPVVQENSKTSSSTKTNLLTFIPTNPTMTKNGVKTSPSISHQCVLCKENCDPKEMIPRDGFFYHSRCLKCGMCRTPVGLNDTTWVGGRPYCDMHYESALNVQKNFTGRGTSKENVVLSERTIPIQITDIKSKHPIEVKKSVRSHNSASMDNISEISSSHSSNRHSTVIIERLVNNHVETGSTMYTKKSHTPPAKRMVRFDTQRHSMKNLSKIAPEHHCVVCGKIVYPSVKVSHKSRIYHDTCIRCEVCHQPLTVNTMHVMQGMILCNKHYALDPRNRAERSSMRAVSLERIKHISSEDETTVTIDDIGMSYEKPSNILKISPGSAFVQDQFQDTTRNNSSISLLVNRKPPSSPRSTSYTLSTPTSSPRESQQEYRIRNGSPYEHSTHSQTTWSGEVNREVKTSKEVSRVLTVNERTTHRAS